jgi:hypothetical protein
VPGLSWPARATGQQSGVVATFVAWETPVEPASITWSSGVCDKSSRLVTAALETEPAEALTVVAVSF